MLKTPNLLRLLAVAMLLAIASTSKSQPTMTLTDKQQTLAAVGALGAKGDIETLKTTLRQAFDKGLTLNELKEALSHIYAYTGFPRSLNALGALQQVVQERTEAGLAVEEGRDATPLSPTYDALRQGTEVQTKLSGRAFNYTFAPQTDYYLKAHLFGDIFARDVLTPAERELVTIGAISALEGCHPQLVAHLRGGVNMGLTEAEVKAIPAVLETLVSPAEAHRCHQALAAIYADVAQEGAPVDFSIWPKGVPNTAYAQYFTGNSYVAPLDAAQGGPVNVTFEPGCRNNWHIHHGAVQVLICVSGRGWYQEWGKEPVAMTPGTVIAIPAEAKHWHGAAKDSWFQHLTYHTHMQPNSSNEWLEPVTDEVYNQLP